jgi:hypothetical protein
LFILSLGLCHEAILLNLRQSARAEHRGCGHTCASSPQSMRRNLGMPRLTRACRYTSIAHHRMVVNAGQYFGAQ